MSLRRRAALLWLAVFSSASILAAQQTLLVHLPSSPIEGAARQAAAVARLASLLSEQVDGLSLEPELFRRLADAQAFLERSPDRVALLITDAAWVPELARSGFAPAFQLRRGGSDSYRRLLVVPVGSAVQNLGDLRGSGLTVVDTTPASGPFLRQAVFSGEIDAETWFSGIDKEVDDFAAVNAVLFGTSDATLVAEYNPLLAANLGEELRVIYRSPPLPLPVISWRQDGAGALDGALRSSLERAVAGMRTSAEGQALMAELGMEALVAVGSAGSRLVALPETGEKTFEISAPSGRSALRVDPPVPPPSSALTYRLAIELPEVDLRSGAGGSGTTP
ncbi:MAG: phosphate/phosphite/phosphonate ABC transporter substrate-binding protein [Thermoanaerobaculia bacterium]|nr:phosphate/phosphite/phosphonate ABC transporter substrate-binding protein [Thermoanaerobaculia bacterium]